MNENCRYLRLAAVLAMVIAGCRTGDPGPGVIAGAPPPPLGRYEPAPSSPLPETSPPRRDVQRPLTPAVVVPAAHQQPEPLPSPSDRAEPPPQPPATTDDERANEGEGSLSLAQLIAEVEERNPSLQAMTAAWQAAAERYPQAVALDDPMFMAMLAPGALGDRDVHGGQQLQVTQRVPWPGKRRARGDAAQSEADAAYHELEEARLELRLMTQAAYYEYYLTREYLRLNRENTAILQRFRDVAEIRFQNNLVTQQDVLQADVELHELARRQLELTRMQRVAAARINTLLRRPPDAPLPEPEALPAADPPEEPSLLIAQALAQRPDLAALAHRIEAEQAALTLAHKNYLPDVDVIGAYNAMMPEKEMWGQVGVGMNIPLYRQKRHAAVAEAEQKISQRVAEYEQKQLDIQYDVQSAFERLDESRQAMELYRQKLIPTAQLNAEATQANYENANATFLDLATAQRQLIALREKEQEAVIAWHLRRAELERAVGGR
ncbi:MAG TPA: TolC family protein [Pirellulaceae bacterium]|nr:TolC family protein [Pirellulaceae bacterium]